MKVKSKIKKLKLEPKPIDKDGYPIKRWEICFVCEKRFCLAFSFSQQNYSRRNFWHYWSEKDEDRKKFIDNICLKNFYFDLENRKKLSPKQKHHLSSYISRGMLFN